MLDFRFPTAMQMVLSVAVAEKTGVRATSAVLAKVLEANPSFIRKLMVPLTRNGIIVSTLGRNRMKKPPPRNKLRQLSLKTSAQCCLKLSHKKGRVINPAFLLSAIYPQAVTVSSRSLRVTSRRKAT